jgi:nifR3 family TIM-barrel protein
MSFWNNLVKLERPIVGLSPMDGVTDASMRYMSAKYGRPDVMFSEFVSVDALHYASSERRERLLKTFIKARDMGPLEHKPYEVAQIFGHTPELFREAAELVEQLGFDGIDINMGCPAHKVEELGSGAGLVRTPEIAKEIVRVVKSVTKLPVSVKTRLGVGEVVAEQWMETLMEVEPAMISLHGRTLKQLYQGEANWEEIGKAAQVVHAHGGYILGNGDIGSVADGLSKAEQYGVDGFLIGRAAEGNPWVFTGQEADREQKLAWILEHAKFFERINKPDSQNIKDGDTRWFLPVRKHLAWYAHGFPGAVELRAKLVQANSVADVERIV